MLAAAFMLFAAANLIGGALFVWDKRAAIAGVSRVRERTLLSLGALGAAPAMLTLSRLIRHKTHKQPFRVILQGIAMLQVLALAALLVRTLS